jgi:PmbA protein
MTDDLLSLAEDTVRRALKAGAHAADALAVDRRGIEVSVREGRIEKLEQAEAREVGLRVFIGHASAMIAGSFLDPAGLDRLAEHAVAMAKAAPPDPYAGLPDSSLYAREFPDLDLFSPVRLSADRLKADALAMEESALAVEGVTKSGGADASFSERAIALATSGGFGAGYRRTSSSLSASAIAGDGTAMERDYEFSAAVSPDDLWRPEDIGRIAGERAVKRLKPRKLKSETLPVLYDPRVSPSLVGHLIAGALGSSIAKGTSFLKDKRGERIFRPGVTILDDPLRPRGLASRPFDAEGLASRPFAVISDGVLEGWFLDLHSARQLKLQPNGFAGRGLSSPPSPSSTNVHLAPGASTPEELMKGIGRGLYISEFIGSSINLLTGDYSRGASGFLIENGEITYPVSEITIAGNLTEMFLRLTPANDLEFRRAVNAPTCLVEAMTVGGL